MTEVAHRTDIYLVDGLHSALITAHQLGAQAVGLDMEGVIGNYVGNDPYAGMTDDFMRNDGEKNVALIQDDMRRHTETTYGIITNNTNKPNGETGQPGLVTHVADLLDIRGVHKGMEVSGIRLSKKPSGDQASYFCRVEGVEAAETVLIDDQGVKNAGEAVKAGLKAIIVPDPIGLPRPEGDGIVEHKWVERFRAIEPHTYRSLRAYQDEDLSGRFARVSYWLFAGVSIDQLGKFYDLRAAARIS